MTPEQIEFYKKTFDMNLKVKNLLYIAATSPDDHKRCVNEAKDILDNHWGLPSGYFQSKENTNETM